MKKKFIVCTTINEPTEALVKFSEMKDWELMYLYLIQQWGPLHHKNKLIM